MKIQRTLILATMAAAFSASALADRPMNTDSANTANAGTGFVETWYTKIEDTNGFSVAPAYSLADGLQLGGMFSRLSDDGVSLTSTGLNLKWRITPSQASGCNVGVKLEFNRVKLKFDGFTESGNATGITGLGTCNFTQGGSLHANLGFIKPNGGSSSSAWGLGYEHNLGVVTPHIEVNGGEDLESTLTIGARGDIAKNVQLDGSFSRTDGVNIVTVGARFRF